MICEMFDAGMIEFGNKKLKDGRISPIFINLRRLPSYPFLMEEVAKEMLRKMHTEQFLGTRLAGLPMSGLPLAMVMGHIAKIPVLYPRQQVEEVEGFHRPGEDVIAIDDVLTDGKIKAHQINVIRNCDLNVRDLLVVVNRHEGGDELMEENKIRVHSLMDLDTIVETLYQEAGLAHFEYTRTKQWIKDERDKQVKTGT